MPRLASSLARTLILTAVFAAPAGLALAADGAKCTIAKPDSDVGKACAAGGVKEAKKVMKEMVKAAKKKEWKGDCDTCHKDTEGKFELTDTGRDDFAKMVALLKK